MSTKYNDIGKNTNQKSHKPKYHHDTKQTDERLVTPPIRNPGESLGQGIQGSVIRKEHSDTHPELQQKKQDNTKRVLPVKAVKPVKGSKQISKQIVTSDGILPKD